MEPTNYYHLLNAIKAETKRHKVFISYHHCNDQGYKKALLELNEQHDIFIDYSVDTGDIDEGLDDQTIRQKIRDEYLRESTVTIVLVGTETQKRKHIDWEIYSSMHDGKVNKRSGILIINLPSINCNYFHASHEGEKERLYPKVNSWISVNTRTEYERRYPYMPARIVDNLLVRNVSISVVNWDKIADQPDNLCFLIDATHKDKGNCEYDLTRPMKKRDS